MTDHPVKPTKENYEKGRSVWRDAAGVVRGVQDVLDYGFQEGADHELRACCAWLRGRGLHTSANDLEKARRPSLKTRALVALDKAVLHGESFASSEATKVIRQALESIDE